MNPRAVKADAVYILRLWARTPSAVVMTLLLPLLTLVGFGVIFGSASGGGSPVLLVADADGSDASARVLQRLHETGTFRVEASADPGSAPLEWAKREGAAAALVLPHGFSTGEEPTLGIATTDAAQARAIEQAVAAALARARDDAPRYAMERAPTEAPVPYTAFLLPGVIGMNVFTVGLTVGYASIAQLRHMGLLERLAVSPMTKREWLLARMIGVSVISLAGTTLLVLASLLVFRDQLVVTPRSLLLVVGGTLLFSGLGTILGVYAKQQETGGMVINLLILPMVLLSGSFFDTKRLPEFLQWLPAVSPLTYLNRGLRADMVAGDGATALLYGSVLFAASVVLLAAATRVIPWTDD